MRAAQKDDPTRRARVQRMRRKACAEGDAYLAELLDGWLERYGQTNADA